MPHPQTRFYTPPSSCTLKACENLTRKGKTALPFSFIFEVIFFSCLILVSLQCMSAYPVQTCYVLQDIRCTEVALGVQFIRST